MKYIHFFSKNPSSLIIFPPVWYKSLIIPLSQGSKEVMTERISINEKGAIQMNINANNKEKQSLFLISKLITQLLIRYKMASSTAPPTSATFVPIKSCRARWDFLQLFLNSLSFSLLFSPFLSFFLCPPLL